MASVDSQSFSPILEKRNFKDLLEGDIVAVEEDLITKIFSQTIQVSPSEETPETRVTGDEQEEFSPKLSSNGHSKEEEEEVVQIDLQENIDKVPNDFSLFNRTIVDLDEEEEIEDLEDESEVAMMEQKVSEREFSGGENTPSTASPVDEQSEIRDFEEIERITQTQEEQEQEPEEEKEEIHEIHSDDEMKFNPVPEDEIPESAVEICTTTEEEEGEEEERETVKVQEDQPEEREEEKGENEPELETEIPEEERNSECLIERHVEEFEDVQEEEHHQYNEEPSDPVDDEAEEEEQVSIN